MNKESVYLWLEEAFRRTGMVPERVAEFNAQAIAQRLSQKRTLISHHLNNLQRERQLIKITTRPVLYLPVSLLREEHGLAVSRSEYRSLEQLCDDRRDSLEMLIGARGSLEEAIRQCKAAISYPGSGLPVLLRGPTGTGKSFLANQLWRYATEQGVLARDAPFMAFNCAEYANNPELLTSRLFGHMKGAFTGADRNVEGLIEASDGGILFIDEVHRLSPEGQEKLFHFMDNGTWRRLGENSSPRHATVRLIFATTEDPDAYLLATFSRRIPVVVKILPVADRGQHERMAFIDYFFRREAKRLDHDLCIDPEIIQHLLEALPEGNVGGLENRIRNICASAWAFGPREQGVLGIKAGHLPDELLPDIPLTGLQDKLSVTIRREEALAPVMPGRQQAYQKLAQDICSLCDELAAENISTSVFERLVYQNTLHFLDALMNLEGSGRLTDKRQRFIEDVCRLIVDNYDLRLSGEFAFLTGRYLTSLPLMCYEPEERYLAVMQRWIADEAGLPQRIANKLLHVINAKYELLIGPLDRVVVTAIVSNAIDATASNKIKAAIVAHGYSTASSIASVANHLIGEKIFHAMDMPFEVAFSDISSQIVDYFQHIDTRAGAIILIDMGYSHEIAEALSGVIDGPLVVVDNITTRLALNIASEIALQKPIAAIAEETVPLNKSHWDIYWPQKKKEKVVLVTCVTGIGTAQKFKHLMETSLIGDFGIGIIACEFTRLKNDKLLASLMEQYEVIAIVGTLDPQVQAVPYVGIEELLGDQGYERLSQVLICHLNDRQIAMVNQNMVREFSLHNVVNGLTILNASKTIGHMEEIIQLWQQELGFSFSNNLVIGLYVHLSCMIERLVMRNEIHHYDDLSEFVCQHQRFINLVEQSFQNLKALYNVSLPPAEIGYIHDIFRLRIPAFEW